MQSMQKESLIKKVAITPQPELGSASNLSSSIREPLPTIQTYCQSKTFIAAHGINNLVASASGLFSLLSKLRELFSYENITQLKQDLIHEIKAFECAALNHGYAEQQILIARYAICATLDDAILHTSWGAKSNWQEDTLLYIFHGEMWGGERLFTLLEHLKSNSEEHIALLEFIYTCMSLGFEGKYRVNAQDKDSFYAILDTTYRLIKNARGDLPEKLSNIRLQTPITQKNAFQESAKKSFIPRVLLVSGGVILSMYMLFAFVTRESAQPILKHIQQIEQNLS
ncbi:MAG: hypothetical protein CMF49_09950 [Legionellales bacterium]|nr:hypothetical protein [Legionellales bacterium]